MMGVLRGRAQSGDRDGLRMPAAQALLGLADAERLGISLDAWLYRSTPLEYLTLRGQLKPNPKSVAIVELESGARGEASSLSDAGLNFSPSPSMYHRWHSDSAMVRVRVGDLIAHGCRLYADVGSRQSKNLYATLPSRAPIAVEIFSNQDRGLLERVRDAGPTRDLAVDGALLARGIEDDLSAHAVVGTLKGVLQPRIRGFPQIGGNGPVWGGVFDADAVLIQVTASFGESALMRGCVDQVAQQFGFSARPASGIFECVVKYAQETLPYEEPLQPSLIRKPLYELSALVEAGIGNSATRALLCAACLELFSREREIIQELRLDCAAHGALRVSLRSGGEEILGHTFY